MAKCIQGLVLGDDGCPGNSLLAAPQVQFQITTRVHDVVPTDNHTQQHSAPAAFLTDGNLGLVDYVDLVFGHLAHFNPPNVDRASEMKFLGALVVGYFGDGGAADRVQTQLVSAHRGSHNQLGYNDAKLADKLGVMKDPAHTTFGVDELVPVFLAAFVLADAFQFLTLGADCFVGVEHHLSQLI